MAKPKVSIRRISEKEMYEGMSPKRIERLKEDLYNIRFASKLNLEVFGGTSASVPIPVHLLGRKLSKNDEYLISQMVALIVNDHAARYAKTAQYIHKAPKDDKHSLMIVKNSKYAVKRGKEHKALLKKLWARKEKLKKHEMFRLALGI